MIRFSQLSLRRGAKVLLEGADATLNPGDRVGLIGANGSGKSSLFALLRGELHADKGEVDFPAHWRIAHVAQETPALDRPALECAIDGDDVFRGLERELSHTEDGNRIFAYGGGRLVSFRWDGTDSWYRVFAKIDYPVGAVETGQLDRFEADPQDAVAALERIPFPAIEDVAAIAQHLQRSLKK